jgi:DNA-binding MarR family transcriptional regulator
LRIDFNPRKKTVPKQIQSDALSAIENSVRRHPNEVSAQEILQGLGAEIPRRTLQYRLKFLVERNRLVMIGEGRWAKYRISDAPPGASAKTPGVYSPDPLPGTVTAPRNPEAKTASALAQDLGVLTSKLMRRLRGQADAGDLTISQGSVVIHLEKDGPATASSLARLEGMRPQSLRTVIAALEAAGFVTSAPDPADGRQTLFSLTDACRRWVQQGRAARQDWLTRTIQARLSPQEQNQLTAAVGLLKRVVND